ncbi:hypothetical protein GCM10020370_11080 [Paenibacillus hodogayensis]
MHAWGMGKGRRLIRYTGQMLFHRFPKRIDGFKQPPCQAALIASVVSEIGQSRMVPGDTIGKEKVKAISVILPKHLDILRSGCGMIDKKR